MIFRCVAACLIAVVLSSAAGTHASAHGVSLKGQEIDRATVISGTTGACSCDDQWYTVGLQPGVFQLTGALARCGDPRAPACSITVFLMRGNRQVKQFGMACLKASTRCTQQRTARYRVGAKGAYYVLVRGGGGEHVDFRLTFSGPIYALHCGRYC